MPSKYTYMRSLIAILIGGGIAVILFIYGFRFLENYLISDDAREYCEELSCGSHLHILDWLALSIFLGFRIGLDVFKKTTDTLNIRAWQKTTQTIIFLLLLSLAVSYFAYNFQVRHARVADIFVLIVLLIISVLSLRRQIK